MTLRNWRTHFVRLFSRVPEETKKRVTDTLIKTEASHKAARPKIERAQNLAEAYEAQAKALHR